MKLRVELVTKVDVIAVDSDGKTYTFKLSENPVLKGISLGDNLYMDGGILKVEETVSTEQLAQKITEEKAAAPRGGRGSTNNARALDAYR